MFPSNQPRDIIPEEAEGKKARGSGGGREGVKEGRGEREGKKKSNGGTWLEERGAPGTAVGGVSWRFPAINFSRGQLAHSKQTQGPPAAPEGPASERGRGAA